jgi:hypothetical protein
MTTLIATPEPVAVRPSTFVKGMIHDLNLLSALRAGLWGAVAMTIYMFVVPRVLGIPQMDIGIIIGAIFDPTYGPLFWVGWMLWHVLNAVIYVFPYALVMWLMRQVTSRTLGIWWQSDLFSGFVFGVILLTAGPMTSIPMMLRDITQEKGLTNPGWFMLDLHLGLLPAFVDLGAHTLHGCLVGILYKQRET